MINRLRFRVLALVVTAVAAAAVAACGSSSNSSPAAKAGSSGGQTACASQAKQYVTQARAAVPPETPASFGMSANRGKRVYLVTIIANSLSTAIANGFSQAAKAAGMQPTVIYGDGSAQSWDSGVSKAVAAGAKGLVLFGINPTDVSAPLAQDPSMTVVDMFDTSSNDPLYKGVYAHVTANFVAAGTQMANWVLAKSGCHNAHIGTFYSSVNQILVEFAHSLAKTVASAKGCSGCSVSLQNVDLNTLSTAFGAQVHSYLTSNPNTNYLAIAADGWIPDAEPSLASFSSIPILGHDGVDANLNQIRSGGQQKYDAAFPPGGWMGWAVTDQLARGMLKLKPQNWVIPTRVIDSTNAGASNAGLFATYSTFESAFKKAWGLG